MLIAGVIGAVLGSSVGIAAFGDAIAGTIPLGLLAAYLMYLWTGDKAAGAGNDTPLVQDAEIISDDSGQAVQDPWRDMQGAARDSLPVLVRFFGASWNLLMKGLVFVRLMPYCRRYPWLLAVFLLLLVVIVPPLGIFFLISSIIAMEKGFKPETDFMVKL